MDVLLSAFKALIDAGSYVMLPIIITIIGLIFRLPCPRFRRLSRRSFGSSQPR